MLYVCTYAPVSVYVCIYVCFAYLCMWRSEVNVGCLSQLLALYVFETGFLIKFSLSLPTGLGWLASKLQESACPHAPLLGLQMYCLAQLLYGYCVWTQGSSWLTPIFPTELLLKTTNWNYRKQLDSVKIMPYGYPTSYKLAGDVHFSSITFWIAGVRYVQLKEIWADTLDRNASAESQRLHINFHTCKLESLVKLYLKVYKQK